MVRVLIDHIPFTVTVMDPHLLTTPCVFTVIKTTFHSLEVGHCHFKTTWALESSLKETAVCWKAYNSAWRRQQGMGRWTFRGLVLCQIVVLSGPSLFPRCLWFGISSGQKIALETLNRNHSIPYYSMCFFQSSPEGCVGFYGLQSLELPSEPSP